MKRRSKTHLRSTALALIALTLLLVQVDAQTCTALTARSLPDVSLPNSSQKVAVGDFNLDGRPDLAVAMSTGDANPDRVAVMFGDGISTGAVSAAQFGAPGDITIQ